MDTVSSLVGAIFGSGGFVPTVWSWVTSSAVLPYFAIGIACSAGLFAVRAIKSVVWGA